jgi:hypothetical protein
MTITLRRTLYLLAAVVLALASGVVAVASASTASTSTTLTPVLTGIRTGQHPGYDRIVLDMSGTQPGGVTYSWGDELTADPSGEIVWLTGEYFLAVAVHGASAHDDAGQSTYPGPQKFRTRDLRNVMAVALTGDFEAVLSIGIGTRYSSWVRVFTLSAPTRVVIDVGS